MKRIIIEWAIRQIVKDSMGSYADMRYLEDVLENEMGEKMFIFSHKLVPINKTKLDEFNSRPVVYSDVTDCCATEEEL